MRKATSPSHQLEAQQAIATVCDELKQMLIDKNNRYGNSVFEPIRFFSQAPPLEQILVRIDDKLARIKHTHPAQDNEDTLRDLAGYLIILLAYNTLYHQPTTKQTIPPTPNPIPPYPNHRPYRLQEAHSAYQLLLADYQALKLHLDLISADIQDALAAANLGSTFPLNFPRSYISAPLRNLPHR
jgi:hypothetical protein